MRARCGLFAWFFSALVALGSARAMSAPVGFGRAIETATARVVKLYGLGVGKRSPGYGSGIVVSHDGYVLTVLSLLIDASPIRVAGPDGTRYEADVVYRDSSTQLALLKLRPPGAELGIDDVGVGVLPYFDLSYEASIVPGSWVVTAGNPFKIADGAEPASAGHGVFSARIRLDARRGFKDFPYRGDVLLIDAITSNPGAPGSAMVNLDGELVGMVGRVVESNLTRTNLNYAIPRDVLWRFLQEGTQPEMRLAAREARKETKNRKAVDTGIRMSKAGYMKVQPFVERVRMGSPASLAGVRKNDLILSVNGRQITSVEEYQERLRSVEPGEPIGLVLRRGRRILEVRVEVEGQ